MHVKRVFKVEPSMIRSDPYRQMARHALRSPLRSSSDSFGLDQMTEHAGDGAKRSGVQYLMVYYLPRSKIQAFVIIVLPRSKTFFFLFSFLIYDGIVNNI